MADEDLQKQLDELKSQNDELMSRLEAESEATKGLKADLFKAKKKLRDKEDINPEEVLKLEAEVEELRSGLTSSQKKVSEYEKSLKEKDTLLNETISKSHADKIDADLTKALSKAGVTNSTYLDAVKAVMKGSLSVKEGEVMAGDKALADHIKEWSESEDAKHFINPMGNSGNGATNQHQQFAVTKNLTGNKGERVQAISAMFPDLPQS